MHGDSASPVVIKWPSAGLMRMIIGNGGHARRFLLSPSVHMRIRSDPNATHETDTCSFCFRKSNLYRNASISASG